MSRNIIIMGIDELTPEQHAMWEMLFEEEEKKRKEREEKESG